MRFHAIAIALFFVGIASIATPCFAQSTSAPAKPVQAAPPADLPLPVSPPKVLSGDDRVVPQCVGVASAQVKLELVVTADGDAKDVRVLDSPSEKQATCAVETVRGYKFLPAMRDGNPVQIKMTLTINLKVS